MNKKTFVSSADYRYFPILVELVHSIQSFEQSKDFDICIFNAGMTVEQVKILQSYNCKVKEAQWPCELPAAKIKDKEYLKSCICRPFIPDYFPEYETYFWLDADTWIQKWQAVELFIKGAEKNKITLTAQSDRAYKRQFRLKWFGNIPIKVRGFYFSNAKQAYSAKKAKDLYSYTVLLAGAFALKKDAPHWKRWQEILLQTLGNGGKIFTAEQLSLGILCYLEDYPYEVLPAYVHWLCEYKPMWDNEKKYFVEPFLPHEELGILHISGWDKMRLNRSVTTDFETLDNNKTTLSYRYPHFNGEKI